MDNTTSTNSTTDYFLENMNVYYIFTPLLLIILLLTIVSNMINILMVMQTMRKCTSMNIFFLDISCFNLLLIFNQIILITLVLRRGASIPPPLCGMALMINTVSSYGVALVHLLLSWDRYTVAKKPISWIQNRRKAWIYSAIVWIGVTILAIYNLMFYLEDTNGDLANCFIPSSKSGHFAYRIALDVLNLTVLVGVATTVYTFHRKTSHLLKRNERLKKKQLEETSLISVNKTYKTVYERAIHSIEVVFTIHLLTQTPRYVFNIVRHALPPNINTPLPLFILTSISFITAVSPMFMLLNSRYKQNVKLLFKWIWPNKMDEWTYLYNQGNTSTAFACPFEQPKYPKDRLIFFSRSGSREPLSDYSVAANSLSSHPRDSQTSMMDVNQTSVAIAAMKAGLVLSAAGHQIQMNNFFINKNRGYESNAKELLGEDT